MDYQGNRAFNVEPKYISNPDNDEFVTIYRNKLDNKYYGRRKNGTDEPLGDGGSGSIEVFSKQINGGFDLTNDQDTFNQCFIQNLQPGTYIFDAVGTFRCLDAGFYNFEAITNTDNSINVSPGDVSLNWRDTFHGPSFVDGTRPCVSIITGPIVMASAFSFKIAASKTLVLGPSNEIVNITMRATKIA